MFLTKTAKFPLQILIDHSRENGLAAYLMSKLSIKAPSPRTCTKILSGGNQQKVAIAKWMSKQPVILMLDEPTRGVDIAARRDIYELLKRQAQEGNSVIIVSSDVEEVAMVSTRVLVMRDFSIVGELVGEDISQSNIIHLVTEPNQTSNRA
jgi:ribose transport system ATP-binding protein